MKLVHFWFTVLLAGAVAAPVFAADTSAKPAPATAVTTAPAIPQHAVKSSTHKRHHHAHAVSKSGASATAIKAGGLTLAPRR